MTIDPILLAFPEFIQTHSISREDLQNLDTTLTSFMKNLPEDAEEKVINWCMERQEIRDNLLQYAAQNNREVRQVKDKQKMGVCNLFKELSETVKEKLKTLESENNSNVSS